LTLQRAFSKRPSISALCWLLGFAATFVWTAHRIGAFDLWATIDAGAGGTVRVAQAFGTVDHPFHAVRAQLLLDSWRHFHSLRWVFQHQGGYPAEFYPFGAAALDVVGWALTFGELPMALVHKLVVIIVFLAPSLGFWLIGRRAGLSHGGAFVATAAQIAVRGEWWSGGSQELIEWGMVTNVAAATELLIALPFLVGFALTGKRRDAGIAAALAALALYTNPRSFIALVAMGAGSLAAVWLAKGARPSVRSIWARLGLAALTAALAAAPEIFSLLRFNHLYYFVRYSWYTNLTAYVHSSVAAVSAPVFVVGLGGIVAGLLRPRHAVIRATAFSLILYVAATAYFVLGVWPADFAEQLETTRLMPFQRLLWLAMAGYGAYLGVDFIARKSRRKGGDIALALLGVVVLFAYVASPWRAIPVSDRGLQTFPTAAQPGIVDLETAVRAADERAAPGTALLILGTTFSWHDQLWAPLWTDQSLFYNDWLWYWQAKNFGDYDPTKEHTYPNPASALSSAYFTHHGIGAVVVVGAAQAAAHESPLLNLVRQGIYDVYVVRKPTAIVTIGGGNASSVTVSNDTIGATGMSDGSPIVVRRNWFPRWQATVNGKAAPVTETADGYMHVTAPAGVVDLRLRYVVDRWDRLGRLLAVIGVVMTLGFLGPARWLKPIGRLARR